MILGDGKAKLLDYPVVLDALEIPDPYVYRVLVDMKEIERAVLMRTNEEACHVFKPGKDGKPNPFK
jgi:hypothetical protein